MTQEVMMADSVEVGQASPSARKDPNDPANSLPQGAPDALAEAARGRVDEDHPDGAGEKDALDFLLGATKPLSFDVPVKYDTDNGRRDVIFHVRQVDGDRILALEKEHRRGDGPFAELDDVAFNAALVAEATIAIIDRKSGREVDPKSEAFVGGAPGGPAMAVKVRFKFQSGLLDGVAGQIRSVSGYNPSRVESANAAIRDAVGSS
jgi:hypothetical protein